ncbi:hypothetical protein [uncultured Draconibacterium sp.]|uniref:hypothetical protein n=1 Tax=uncultured Draconibacterium sp. TaxID=1573823 RepID=UPI002AA8AA95|nr:hypothetical protein [uncultured Draconibacterium sp.]
MRKTLRFCIVTIILALNVLIGKAQNQTYQLTDSPLNYKLISFMTLGEMEYFDDFDNDGEAGFRNRLIVQTFETHENLFIEKIIVDVEGIPNKIEWCKRINLSPLTEKLELEKEYTLIEAVEWSTHKSFYFKLNGKQFYAKIKDNDNIEIVSMN